MEFKNKLLLIGASGHGKVVADIALKMNIWEQIYFLDDNDSIVESMGLKIIGKTEDAFKYLDEADIFVAIGSNKTREVLQERLETAGVILPVLIHPSVVIGEMVEIGAGSVFMAGVAINCCSTIGKGCILNTGVTVDHDNSISDFVHISPGANLAGTVKIGKGTWIGIGATIINNINIAGGCVIGAGAVVVKDIHDIGTYIGIPAKRV